MMSCGVCLSEDFEAAVDVEDFGIGGIEAVGEIWECRFGPIVVLLERALRLGWGGDAIGMTEHYGVLET